jgi:hypothetical protein
VDSEEQRMNFEEADRRYVELKRRYDAGEVSDEEFDEQRRSLMVSDEGGRWWAKSRRTGEWHYHDGNVWVNAIPPYEPSTSSREPEGLSITKPSIDELIQVCDKYHGPRFYVGDAIPEEVLSNARSYLNAPDHERVAALVDNSRSLPLLGWFGLAICEEGVHWRADAALGPKRGVIEWHAFAEVSIKVRPPRLGSKSTVEIGRGKVLLDPRHDMHHDELARLLFEIQRAAVRYR